MSTEQDRSALTGLSVVELGGGIAIPSAGMFFADYGARVVKVEPRAGDPARSLPGFHFWNRGKESLQLDPDDPGDRDTVRALVLGADLCLYADPAQLSVFGLDPAELATANPRLVLLFMPPYQGPAPWPGNGESAELLSATLGMAINQCSFTGGPVELVEPQILYVHGVWAATCAVAALVERERTGRGQRVTVSGVHAFAVFAANLMLFDPAVPPLARDVGPGGPNPTYTCHRAADGEWFFVGALPDKYRRRLLSLLALDHILDDPRIAGDTERLFASDNREWVRAAVAGAFATRDRAHWLGALDEADLPTGPVSTPEEWFDHEHLRHIGARLEVSHPRLGAISMPGRPFDLSASPAVPATPAPDLGVHREPVVGRPAPVADRAARTGPTTGDRGPLSGFRVMALGAYVAGPYCARLLRALDAEVVKVEDMVGDPWRANGFQFCDGMRGFAIDLRVPTGQEVFRRLARTADVVVDNFRNGVMRRFGIDYDSLRSVNPTIISVSITGFGRRGPLAERPGFDPVLGAMSGMQRTQGGPDEPVVLSLPVNDTATAALGALATCIALYHRLRAGVGGAVDLSLARTATFLQCSQFMRYRGAPPPPVGRRDFRGGTPWARYYRTADGWVRIDSTAEALARLPEAGIDVERSAAEPEMIAAIGRAVETRDSREVLAALAGAGVRATAVRNHRVVVDDPVLAGTEVVRLVTWPDGTSYYIMTALSEHSSWLRRSPLQTPGLGEETSEVLIEAGFGADEIRDLIADRVIFQGRPTQPVVPKIYR